MAEDYNKKKDEILVGNNAKTIRDHLVELENNPKNHQRRWFWELLQNAKDVAIEGQPLKVKLILNERELTFMHNGRPFDADELIHIIFHGSTKDQLEGKTGKFGTGFMTTHLLSKRVQVTGNAKNGAYVDFLLDRSPAEIIPLKEALDKSYDKLIDQLNKNLTVDLGEFQTSFTYFLNEKTKRVAEEGIVELKAISATVLAFNDSIDSIEVIENVSSWNIQVLSRDAMVVAQATKVTCGINGEKLPISNIVYTCHDDLQISLFANTETNSLALIPSSIPKIFLDFPLFGSENIGLPLLINSKCFQPLRERTGIYLNPADSDGTHAIENQELIQEAIEMLPTIAQTFSEHSYENLKFLLGFKTPQVLDWIDCAFMDGLYCETLQKLFNVAVIPFEEEKNKVIFKSVNELYLPVLPDEFGALLPELHRLITVVFPRNVPVVEDWKILNEYRQNWKTISINFSELTFDFGGARLLAYVSSNEKLGTLLEKHFDTDKLLFEWLNNVYTLIKGSEQSGLLAVYKCLPNQKNDLTPLVADKIKIDNINDEELKNIAELTEWDIRATLLKPEIDTLDSNLAPEKQKEFLTNLIGKLNDGKATFVPIKEAVSNPLVRLADWCFDNENGKLTQIPFIFSNDNEENPKAEGKFLSTDEKALIPATWWPEQLRFYDQLVSQKFLLSGIYNSILTEEKVQILEKLNLIYRSPLFYEEQNLKRDEALSLFTPESVGKITADHEIEFADEAVNVSKLAWFDAGDDYSVLKRTRDTKKRTGALIKFLIRHLIFNDPSWRESIAIKNVNGETYQIHPSYWLSRLFSNAWVATGLRKTENPNAQNLTSYIKELDLMDDLLKPEVRRFFSVLNISVTDILKNIKYGDYEVKRDEWESAILTILHSNVDPKDAAAMVKDPAVVQFYRDRQAEKEFIENNQQIGKLFEEKFLELFSSPAYQSAGLYIRRVHVGRDYEIAINHDLLDDQGREEFFEIAKGDQKLLLELKATKSEGVGMTNKQVELALETRQTGGLYALVVFPYLTKADITLPNIEIRTRFVTNIADSLVEPYQNKRSLDDKVYVETHRERVTISCRYEDVRFSILRSLWQEGDDFTKFTQWLFNTVGQSSQLENDK